MIGVDNIITDLPILAREVILGEENAENLLARLRRCCGKERLQEK